MIGARKYSGVIRLLMAAALVLFVAACSSSDSGLKSDLKDAEDEVMSLEQMLGTVQTELGTVQAELGTVKTELANLQVSGRQEDQDKIAELEGMVSNLEGMVEDLEDAAAALQQEKDTAMANKVFDVLAEASLGAGTTRSNDGVATATHDGTDVTFAYTYDPSDTADDEVAFKRDKDSGLLTGTVDSNKATAYVYSDIEAPGMKSFSDKWGGNGGAIPINAGATFQTKPEAEWMYASLDPEVDQVSTQATEDGTTTHTLTVAGDFNGAPGTFTCEDTTDPCDSLVIDDDGNVEGDPTGWMFSPTGGVNAMALVPDTDYLIWGFWISNTKDGDPVMFHPFYGASVAARNNAEALTGTATYEGPAAGKYATKDIAAGTATFGIFNATATLEADFGANDAGGTLEGEVTDFDAAGLANLSITLQKSALAAGAGEAFRTLGDSDTGALDTQRDTVAKFGDVTLGSGEWKAHMFGGDDDEHPTGVSGLFDVNYSSGVVIGAFGAGIQDDE